MDVNLIERLLKLVVAGALLITLLNDAGRYLQAQSALGGITKDAAIVSADAYKRTGDRTSSWRAGETLAEKYGAVVYGFDAGGERVHVWTRMPVNGTWAAQRLAALIDGKPANTPLNVESEDLAVVQ